MTFKRKIAGAVSALAAAVLLTGCFNFEAPSDRRDSTSRSSISSKADSESGTHNGDRNNGENTGYNNGSSMSFNNNEGNLGGSSFVAGGKEFNLINAVNSEDSGATLVMFEGTLNEVAVLVVAGTLDSFDNSSTYYQSSFGDRIEVFVCVVDTNNGDYIFGSSATLGISNAKIVTGENTMISVSGTLSNDIYGNMPFSVSGKVTSTSISNIRDKINSYDEFVSSGGSGSGGGYQPIRCTSCYGTGECRSCRGDGSCHICVEGMTHCLSCYGSRICQRCGGSTRCPYCGGDGIMYN